MDENKMLPSKEIENYTVEYKVGGNRTPTQYKISVGSYWLKRSGNDNYDAVVKVARLQVQKKQKATDPDEIEVYYHTPRGKYYKDVTSLEFTSYGSKPLEKFLQAYVLVEDFDKEYKKARGIVDNQDAGELLMVDPDMMNVDETALMGTASKKFFENISTGLEAKKDKLALMKQMVQLVLEDEKNKLAIIKEQMEKTLAIFKDQLKKIYRVIDTIELYLGVHEDIVQIQEGMAASSDTVIHFRQRLLYMDEELVLQRIDADYEDIGEFDEWLLKEKNYIKFVPEEKCIVAFRPRRYKKQYFTDSPLANALANEPNFRTYLLIRNGENIYRIWTTVDFNPRLFPRRNELAKILRDIEDGSTSYKSSSVKAAEDIKYSYERRAFMFQGLLDRTQVFNPKPEGIKIFDLDKWEHLVRFIYDDEDTLPSGRLTFAEWHKKLNSGIVKGSRILITNTNGEKSQDRLNYYCNDYKIPPTPKGGLYTVKERTEPMPYWSRKEKGETRQQFYISYLPTDTVWTGGWSYDGEERQRRQNITWRIYTHDSFVFHYDMLELDDILFYLHDRTDRKNYLHSIPLLLRLEDELRAELKEEEGFKQLVLQMLKLDEQHLDTVEIAVKWWKNEVVTVWKRPITKDTPKALRMVMSRVKKLLGEQGIKVTLPRLKPKKEIKIKGATELLQGIRWERVEVDDWTIWLKSRYISNAQKNILDLMFIHLLNRERFVCKKSEFGDDKFGFWHGRQWSTTIERRMEFDWESLPKEEQEMQWYVDDFQRLFLTSPKKRDKFPKTLQK